jgi:hypothetical protein
MDTSCTAIFMFFEQQNVHDEAADDAMDKQPINDIETRH